MDHTQDWENEPDLTRLNEAYGLLETDPTCAVKELQSLAELGSLYSMLYLGWAYQKGTGTRVDTKQAEIWFRRAYQKGSKLAIYYLGHLYLQQQEHSKAHEVFAAGVSMDYAPAIYCLGQMYVDGAGVSQQPDKARALLERATALGHVFAKRSLAKLLISGQFGFFNIFRGCFLLLGAVKDGLVVGMTEDSSSDRLRT
ncbi:MAG: tetratricopeptide repeat protein [Gammaproteobacteria bacterium]